MTPVKRDTVRALATWELEDRRRSQTDDKELLNRTGAYIDRDMLYTDDEEVSVELPSGMRRDARPGKTRWALVYDGPMLERWARHMTAGAEKHGDRNWLSAHTQADADYFRESAARHFAQWMAGDDECDHAAAVIFNLNGAAYVLAQLDQANEPTTHRKGR